MDFTFLRANGDVAFFRSDAQQAEWCQDEMTLFATFPYIAGKVIERGMVVLFQDPATSEWQAFEVRQCSTFPGGYYQQFTAESLAISELTDCHIQASKLDIDGTVINALNTVLDGTGWAVGNVNANPASSGDIGRGSVWQNVSTIQKNWNVYIVPRVAVDSTGIIGRFLDVFPSSGFDRGLRLAINKNVADPSVVYDDSELYTALYGYGGSYTEGSGESRVTLEYNFSSVEWSKTSEHPAKPAGQRYIEYPEMTELFGRNGNPRFGYYQNTGITDPEILLQKTWESLKQCCEPKVSISGTVTDLQRFGYADQPLRIHDLAIVELEPVGLLLYKQIIKLTVDLLDPTKNRPEIGDYIPNIIYINRETEDIATGGGKGRGGRSSTRVELELDEYRTEMYDNGRQIGMYARKVDKQGNILEQAGMDIDPETGVIVYAEGKDNMIGSMFHVQKDMIESEVHNRESADTGLSSRITQVANKIELEVSERKGADNALSGRITVEANRIAQEVTDRTNADSALSGRITTEAGRITAEVTRAQGAETALSGRLTITENAIAQEVTDRTNADTTLSGRITTNANAITAEVTRAEGAETTLAGRLTITENAITQEVTDRTNADTTLSGRITTTADAVAAEVTRATGAESTLSGRITVNADKVSLVVTDDGQGNYSTNSAEIVAGINSQTGSYVKIKAQTINLSGYVTAEDLAATNATISNLTSGATTAQTLKTYLLSASTGFNYQGHAVSFQTITINGTTYHLMGYT